jgi:hypothetical protein
MYFSICGMPLWLLCTGWLACIHDGVWAMLLTAPVTIWSQWQSLEAVQFSCREEISVDVDEDIYLVAGWYRLITSLLNDGQVTYALGSQGICGSKGVSNSNASPTTPLATAVITLDQGEYFTSISGTNLTNSASSVPVRVASLTFTTNRQGYGPFGVPMTDKPFEVQGPVSAFHGAVARGNMTEVLAAIDFWKTPITKQGDAIGT